jgi:DNA-binding transcriptional regulator GbsR (MarR family)
MNNMSGTSGSNVNVNLIKLSQTIGYFIRYWGFRRIHGQIWTQIFLTQKALSGAELTRSLKVSKALISPALKELLKHKLIFEQNVDAKTKTYTANPDVLGVILNVLQKREAQLIKKAEKNFQNLKTSIEKQNSTINMTRLKELESIISVGSIASDFLINNLSDKNIAMWKRFAEMKIT